jgi:hypothetical protein
MVQGGRAYGCTLDLVPPLPFPNLVNTTLHYWTHNMHVHTHTYTAKARLDIFEFGMIDTKNIMKWPSTPNSNEMSRARLKSTVSSKILTEMRGNLNTKSQKVHHPISFRSTKPSTGHVGSCFEKKNWTQIKSFVSLGLKTFHHFFHLAWKYNTNYFTRRSKCLKNNFTPCQCLLLRSQSVPICSWLSIFFSHWEILSMWILRWSMCGTNKQTYKITLYVEAVLWRLSFPLDFLITSFEWFIIVHTIALWKAAQWLSSQR